jgi:hypothetical protein
LARASFFSLVASTFSDLEFAFLLTNFVSRALIYSATFLTRR